MITWPSWRELKKEIGEEWFLKLTYYVSIYFGMSAMGRSMFMYHIRPQRETNNNQSKVKS